MAKWPTYAVMYTKDRYKSLMVRMGGLEPPQPKLLPPQDSASTNSATSAIKLVLRRFVE